MLRIIWFLLVFILLILVFPFLILGADCDQAETLYKKAMAEDSVSSRRLLLEQVVKLCPGHALAWNNLGAAHEKEGDPDRAYQAYLKSLQADPHFSPCLAGLGDTSMELGRFKEAIGYYASFLEAIEQEKALGDPYGLVTYQDEYQKKHEAARLKWRIHQDSMTKTVDKSLLTEGMKAISIRSTGGRKPAERLALFILFDFDSDKLGQGGRDQLKQMAQAMMSAELDNDSFIIEGHTDTIGQDDYNLDLSRRRAVTVRGFLVEQGVDSKRLTVKGLGETRPLAPSGDRDQQAINRRVEFVNLGH